MISERPHKVTIKWQGSTTYDPDKGLEVPGTQQTLELNCRVSASSRSGGNFIHDEHKGYIKLNFEIYADSLDQTIPEGAKVIVFNKTYTVKQIFQGQMGTKIYV